MGGHGGAGQRLELEPELDHHPDGPQRPQRIVRQRGVRDHPHAPRLEVRLPAVRIEQVAAGQRLGHGVDREVAGGEVGDDVALPEGDEVDVPGLAGPDDPPGAELVGQLERRAAGGARDRPRRLARVALERDVDVVGAAAEQPVAHGAADEPGLAAGERRARGVERLGGHGWCSRGTRAEIPHVTS